MTAGGAVFELRLEKIDDPRAVTNFLQQAVAVFKIGSLWLEACDCRIPTPAQLPRLEYIRARHVQLTGPLDLPDDSDSDSNSNPDSAENYGDMIGQIAALMPQLKGIDLDSNQELPWALLFANPTPRLEQVRYNMLTWAWSAGELNIYKHTRVPSTVHRIEVPNSTSCDRLRNTRGNKMCVCARVYVCVCLCVCEYNTLTWIWSCCVRLHGHGQQER